MGKGDSNSSKKDIGFKIEIVKDEDYPRDEKGLISLKRKKTEDKDNSESKMKEDKEDKEDKKDKKSKRILKHQYGVEVITNSGELELLCLKIGLIKKILDINSETLTSDLFHGFDDKTIKNIEKELGVYDKKDDKQKKEKIYKEKVIVKYLSNQYVFNKIKTIEARSGWHLSKKRKLKYYTLGPSQITDYAYKDKGQAYYDASLNLIEVTAKQYTIPLFSYCILALMYSLYGKAGIKPDFILSIKNKKADGIVELFATAIDPYIKKVQPESYEGNTYFKHQRPWKLHSNDIKSGSIIGIKINKNIEIETPNKDCIAIFTTDRNKTEKVNQLKHLEQNILPIIIIKKELEEETFLNLDFNEKVYNGELYIKLLDDYKDIQKIICCFLCWLEEKISQNKSFHKDLLQLFNTSKKKVEGQSLCKGFPLIKRQVEIYSWLLSAYNMYLNFGLEEGYISKDLHNKLESEAVIYLNRIETAKDAYTGNDKPSYENKLVAQKIVDIVYELNEKHSNLFKHELSFIDIADYAPTADSFNNEKLGVSSGKYLGWISYSRTHKDSILCFDKSKFTSLINYLYRNLYDKEDDLLDDIDNVLEHLDDMDVLKYEARYKRFRRKVKQKTGDKEYVKMIAFRVSRLKKCEGLISSHTK